MDIKTANDFLNENGLTGKLHCRNRELMEYDRGDFRDVLVEFAQYHVQKAIEKIKDVNNHPDAFYEDKTWWIPQDSIVIDNFLKDVK